jgi:hypothetical protein
MPRDYLKPKPVRMAKLINTEGGVSPLCAKKPRALDLTRAPWTPEQVEELARWYVGPDDGNVTKNGALQRVETLNEALAAILGPAPASDALTCAAREARIDADLARDYRFYPGETT